MPCTLQASSRQAGPGDSADEGEQEHRLNGYNQMRHPAPPRGMATQDQPSPPSGRTLRAHRRGQRPARGRDQQWPRPRAQQPDRQDSQPGRTNHQPPAGARVNRPSAPRTERPDLDLKAADLSRANAPAERRFTCVTQLIRQRRSVTGRAALLRCTARRRASAGKAARRSVVPPYCGACQEAARP
jgi:hypothetical protein